MDKVTDDTLTKPDVSLGVYHTYLRIVENIERVLNFIALIESFNHD